MIFDLIYIVGFLYMVLCITWRVICFFRKKGSCKFSGCTFRKDYTYNSCIYFPSGGCTKCPPTPKEAEIYSHTVEDIVEAILRAENKTDG